ncbi:grainyhead-like protein 2 homolog [Pholidichthys leucotaenia]
MNLDRPMDEAEEAAWKIFLESPLIVASKAMMSINGDEDGVAALGMLYERYKVFRERKSESSVAKHVEPPAPGNSTNMDQHIYSLSSVPVNRSQNSTSVEHQDSRYGAVSYTDAKCGGSIPLPLIKIEDQGSYSRDSYQDDSRETLSGVYEQSCNNTSPSSYLKLPENDHRYSSDSSFESVEMDHNSPSSGVDAIQYSAPDDSFQYSLEATISHWPRQEAPMAYLNKGQFYPLTLSAPGYKTSLCLPGADTRSSSSEQGTVGHPNKLQLDTMVQSVVMVIFGEGKGKDEQLKNWKYWHSRQHTAKQRVLDIADYKENYSMTGNIEEIAYNAVSFTWDVTEEAKVFLTVNSLSTDFSSQKGVRGTPLIIQIDTYSNNNGCSRRPIHRAYIHIKVFCDKGAERKLRDEERKLLKKLAIGKKGPEVLTLNMKPENEFFKSMLDLDTQPVLFIPNVHFGNLQRAGQVFAFSAEQPGCVQMKKASGAGDDKFCPLKRLKTGVDRKVLLYVKKERDEVFDALMLHSPSLRALTEAISEKYAVPVDRISKVYQKSKKGVLVNMDNSLIQYLSNEDTFILTMDSKDDCWSVTLSPI